MAEAATAQFKAERETSKVKGMRKKADETTKVEEMRNEEETRKVEFETKDEETRKEEEKRKQEEKRKEGDGAARRKAEEDTREQFTAVEIRTKKNGEKAPGVKKDEERVAGSKKVVEEIAIGGNKVVKAKESGGRKVAVEPARFAFGLPSPSRVALGDGPLRAGILQAKRPRLAGPVTRQASPPPHPMLPPPTHDVVHSMCSSTRCD